MEACSQCPAHPLCSQSLGTLPPDAESLPEQPAAVVSTGHGLPLPLLVTCCCLLVPHEPGPPQKLLLCLQYSHSLGQAVFSMLRHLLLPDSKYLLLY